MSSSAFGPAAAFLVAIGVAFGTGAQTAAGPSSATIRDGVYTVEQARRGQTAYTGPCDRCHGYKLDGAPEDPVMLPAPPVSGAKFLRKWNGRSLATLFEYVRTKMPSNNPGYLSDADVTDIVSYMLFVSGMPAGTETLPPDPGALANVVIVL
jgi:mono/diheme cytochrome c family protein